MFSGTWDLSVKFYFRSSNALFELIWHEDGSISFRGNNGKFVGTKKSGHLYANCDSDGEANARYFFYLVNRPVLVLKCEQGFVGYKTAGATKLECNKATYETIQVERADKGQVYFKGEWHSIKLERLRYLTCVPIRTFIFMV